MGKVGMMSPEKKLLQRIFNQLENLPARINYDIVQLLAQPKTKQDPVAWIEDAIYNNGTTEYPYSEETITMLKYGVKYLKVAQIYAHRIDWLLAGDDGEEYFHKRLASDLEKLNETL